MSALNKYAQLDAKLIEIIKSWDGTFSAIVTRADVAALTAPHETAKAGGWRVVDRRLQALRKAGKIAFSRDAGRWRVA